MDLPPRGNVKNQAEILEASRIVGCGPRFVQSDARNLITSLAIKTCVNRARGLSLDPEFFRLLENVAQSLEQPTRMIEVDSISRGRHKPPEIQKISPVRNR
jgi:hypothetical protein